jgi:hypothetical protein
MLGRMRGDARTGAVVLVLLCVAVASAAARQDTRRNPPPEAVAIDFFATGPDGVVFDLRPDEVTLEIDGRERRIRSLRYVPLPLADPSRPLAEPPPRPEPPFGTNVLTPNARG